MISSTTVQVVLGVYGVLLIVGGLIGFLKAGSRPSLIAGAISGILALVACGFSGQARGGVVGGLVLALAMVVVFGIRLAKGRKFMPSGLLLVVSLVVAVLLGLALAG